MPPPHANGATIRESTLNNENLAGPEPHMPTVNNHNGFHNQTLNNENLTSPPTQRDMGAPLEKDFSHNGNGYQYDPYHMHLDASHDSGAALRKIRTAGSVSITPELFEKLYLSPQTNVHGDLRRTVGNPTPIALIGFLLSLTPLSMDLMGWRGAGMNGAATTGMFIYCGGLLMLLGAVGEWIIGNTFPFVVFGSFGAYWLGFAATLQPFYNAYGAYSPNPEAPAEGLNTIGFRSSFAFFFLAMAIMCLIFLLCSIRTNMVFFMIFFCLVFTFTLLAGCYFQLNNANVVLAGKLQEAAGAFAFVACLFGWWIFVAIMLASLDFPFSVPVGDLSNLMKGASQRNKAE